MYELQDDLNDAEGQAIFEEEAFEDEFGSDPEGQAIFEEEAFAYEFSEEELREYLG